MTEKLYFFSTAEGNMLIRLLMAHILSDFILGSRILMHPDKWFSRQMAIHIGLIYLLSAILTGWWITSIFIALIHFALEIIKTELHKRYPEVQLAIFCASQLLHLIVLVAIWTYHLNLTDQVIAAVSLPISNYKISLILLGYVIIMTPVGHLIKLSMQNIPQTTEPVANREQGGRTIGIFERVIILTFVLLDQYSAIGFLITGKSIIRFANKDEHIRSEYVLTGTMMSYSISIIVGVLINFFL